MLYGPSMTDPPGGFRGRPTDSSTEPIRTRFDWASTTPSMAVVETVAVARNEDPLSLPPLYARIDPDALDALVTSAATPTDDGLRISFSYADHDVTVGSDGGVAVTPH